jgi:hypothetical protein
MDEATTDTGRAPIAIRADLLDRWLRDSRAPYAPQLERTASKLPVPCLPNSRREQEHLPEPRQPSSTIGSGSPPPTAGGWTAR